MRIKKYNIGDNIYVAESFDGDYRNLYGKSKDSFEKNKLKLNKNLSVLEKVGIKTAISDYQQFEYLTNENLFSIRHVSKLNPRVIFAYCAPEGQILLLSCVLEKNKSDYDKAINKANNIIKELGVELYEP